MAHSTTRPAEHANGWESIATEGTGSWNRQNPVSTVPTPNLVRAMIFRVRIILAVTPDSYKAPINFVFFVLAENDNNYERSELDVPPRSGQCAAVCQAKNSLSNRRHEMGSSRARFRTRERESTLLGSGQITGSRSGDRRRTGQRPGGRFPRCFWSHPWSSPTNGP